jgi:hypothetical protein
MPNLTLLVGNNSVAAHTSFSVRPPSLALRPLPISPHSPIIVLRVEKFWTILLGRRVSDFSRINTTVDLSTDSLVTIAGYNESTKIAPLLQAFETINLNVTLPGLKTDLLSSAALTGESLWDFHGPLINRSSSITHYRTQE